VAAWDRLDLGGFESLAANSKETGLADHTAGRKALAPFSGFDLGMVVAAISTLYK